MRELICAILSATCCCFDGSRDLLETNSQRCQASATPHQECAIASLESHFGHESKGKRVSGARSSLSPYRLTRLSRPTQGQTQTPSKRVCPLAGLPACKRNHPFEYRTINQTSQRISFARHHLAAFKTGQNGSVLLVFGDNFLNGAVASHYEVQPLGASTNGT